MQLIKLVETLGGEDSMVAHVKTQNTSVSRLPNVNYPVALSPEDDLAIKNQKKSWLCKRNLLRVVEEGCQFVTMTILAMQLDV